MDSLQTHALAIVEQSLQFLFVEGGVTTVTPPHTTGWRTMPWLMTAHLSDYDAMIEVEHADPLVVTAGDTVCIRPGVRHQIVMSSSAPGVSRWSHVRFTMLGDFDVLSLFAPTIVFDGPRATRIGEINSHLAMLQHGERPMLHHIFARKSLGFQLLWAIAESSSLNPNAGIMLDTVQRLEPALSYLRHHLDHPIQRAELASLLNLSLSRFDSLFKLATGTTVTQYAQRQRLQRAQELLITTSLPIYEVAAQVGYEDPFHFSRLFKKHVAMSPLHYRERMRESVF